MTSVFFRSHRFLRSAAILAGLAALASPTLALAADSAAASALLDDFSNAERSSVGATRLLIDDQGIGSQSSATQSCADGVVTVKGSLAPGRGVPAFISYVFLATPDGKPRDLSAFEGVRLRLKVTTGTISVQAGSSEITNYDYHSSPLTLRGTEFQEVRVPFKAMKRAFSEQTALNLKTIVSINLVAFGMAKSDFSYAVDEISFY